jgi:hypothetical protein
MSTFTCKVCGRTHEGFVDPRPTFTPEEVEKRKAAWLAAEAKLDKAPDNVHFERDQMKAWFAYGATMYSGAERLPHTLTTKKGWKDTIFTCVYPHVELKEATAGFQWSTGSTRSPVLIPAGIYAAQSTWTFLLIEESDANGVVIRQTKACENGEEWVDLMVGSEIIPVITKTSWGLTPFGRVLKLTTGHVSEEQPKRVLEPWAAPPRCTECNAIVHADHLEEHRRYRCKPGLHQPPDALHQLAQEAVVANTKRNAELEAMSPEDRDVAIVAWAKDLAAESASVND